MTPDAFRSWLESLAEAEATIPARVVLGRLPAKVEAPSTSDRGEVLADLTVDEVAQALGRTPSSVRSWLRSGEVLGYKLRGREWRIRREDLRAFLDDQATEKRAHRDRPNRRGEPADLGAWRRELDEDAT